MKILETLKKGLTKDKKEKKKNRMLVLHRKQITALSLLLLVGVSGYINWNFQKDAVSPEVAPVYNEVSKKIGEAQMVSSTDVVETAKEPDQNADYFSQARLERDISRSEAMDMLSEILEADSSDKEARLDAENEIHLLSSFTEKEVMTENLIRAKGYGETIVFMSENSISIAVKSDGLNEVDAAVIQDIATGTTGYSADKIKIVEIK